ncbi:MAG TPA: DUF308 domain-containing protein [Solirubrobacteraceae bacterium]|nr:DUF308 domain-containing protein [Solirubrobacteraceae bacterium]
MTDQAALPPFAPTTMRERAHEAAREYTGYWWLWLVVGIAWLVVSLVVLQFDSASVTTVGIIVGVLFVVLGVQNIALAYTMPSGRWLPVFFGVLFLICGVICFVHPRKTFAGTADILGFLFLMIAIWWMVQAFVERPVNPAWWVGLIAGILMTGVAFWTSGQFFIEKAYVLLVFAGLWALFEGVTDIVRAFEIRSLHGGLNRPDRVMTAHAAAQEGDRS